MRTQVKQVSAGPVSEVTMFRQFIARIFSCRRNSAALGPAYDIIKF